MGPVAGFITPALAWLGGGSVAAGATVAATAVTVGSTIYGADKARSAANRQFDAETRRFEAQQRISSIREARSREQQIRQRRIASAKNIASAQVAGGGIGEGSSGLRGALANLGTQEAANQAFMSQIGNLQGQVANEDMTIFGVKTNLARTQSTIKGVQSVAGGINTIFSKVS